MALVLADRVKETTTTTGTGTYTLAGAADSSFETFASIGNGNTTYYACTDGSDFEVGIGTYTASGTTLARTTILQSSNSDNAVNWGAGTKDIFCTQPAEKAVFRDASGHIIALDGRNLTNVDAATLDSIDSSSFLRSDAADTKTSGDLTFNDSIKAKFGSDSDFQVYHNGTNGYLQESTNAIIYRSAIHSFRNSADTEQLARFDQNGDVELYYDNSKKFITSASGAKTFGQHFIENTDGYGALEVGGTSGGFVDLKSPNSDDYDIRLITTGTGGQFLSQNALRIGSSGTTSITNVSGNSTYANFIPSGAVELFHSGNKKFETSSTGATLTGQLVATSLDISGDVDVDGTLEADAITLNGTALASSATTDTTNASNISSGTLPNARLDAQLQDVAGLAVTNGNFIVGDGSNFVAESGATARTSLGLGTAATLDTGISNTNVPKFTSGVADNDFLRVDGTAIEGRSASQVLSDIGGQASLTFGISNTNAVKIDSTSVADDEYARFTANGLESRSTSEVLSDIGGITASSTDTLTNKTLTTPVINGFSGTGNGSITGDLTLTSTDAGSGSDPEIVFFRNSASPADNDALGKFVFKGNNSAAQETQYAAIVSRLTDATDGTEDGTFELQTITGGSVATNVRLDASSTVGIRLLNGGERNIRFDTGTAFNGSHIDLTPASATGARTVTIPDATGTIQLTDGSGASLTSLNASELSSGTVPNARLDAQLQDVAGLAVTNGGFIVGDGSNFVLETGDTVRTSLGLGTAAVLNTGISNTNVPKFTSGVADDDFLRVAGTSIEGRSASEVLSDIGGQAALTFGISNTNAVKIDSTSVADNEFARFTANGLESRSASEVLSDIGGISASSESTLTNKTLTTPVINGFSGTGDGTITGNLNIISTDAGATADPQLVLYRNSSSPADNDILANIDFKGKNSAAEETVYAAIQAKVTDVTDGTEDANYQFKCMSNGSLVNVFNIKGNGDSQFLQNDVALMEGVNLKFEGSSANSFETTLTVVNPTADRTVTFADASGTVQLTDGSGANLTSLNASQLTSGTVPNARLDAQLQDVAGLAVTNGNFIVGDGSNFVAESGSTARDSLSLGTSSDVQFDSFGVGTAASGTTGEIRATADITSNYSDERLKNIHGTIPNALDKVKSLGGYYFTENEIAKSLGYDNDAQQVGVIAQEVEKVLPEAVKPAPIDDKYLTVQYEKMVPLLIEAMKEQQAKIEELESRLAKLEA